MRTSIVIATCLVNSGMIQDLDRAEHAVRMIFEDQFPVEDFGDWNREISDQAAENVVSKFIQDLADEPLRGQAYDD